MNGMAQQIDPFDFYRMFLGDQAGGLYFLEIVFRTAVMYFYTLFFARVVGQRAVGQISPFEFILVIVIGSASGDAMFYPHVPLLHGMVVMTVVMVLHRLFGYFAYRSEQVEDVMEGEPLLVVRNGCVLEEALGSHSLSRRELMMMLRMSGYQNVGEVKTAIFEPCGQISTVPYPAEQKKETQSTAPEDMNESVWV